MIFLDGTAGGGGHTEKLLQYGAEVIALDQDADAIARCQQRLAAYACRLHLCEANFEEADAVLDQLNVRSLGGALLDLGVSSYQLDTASRGFAMMKDGPLDMRMSDKNPRTAADIVNTAAPAELARIFREYGEEPRAMHIAARIAALREQRPIRTTFDLAAAVTSVVPRTGARHPATRVFQALRIAVNDELGVLSARAGNDCLPARSRRALCCHQLPFARRPDCQDVLPRPKRRMDRSAGVARASA